MTPTGYEVLFASHAPTQFECNPVDMVMLEVILASSMAEIPFHTTYIFNDRIGMFNDERHIC